MLSSSLQYTIRVEMKRSLLNKDLQVSFSLIGLSIEKSYLIMRLKLKGISVKCAYFNLKCMHFAFEMRKTDDFHSKLIVSWELVTEGYQGIPVKCAHFTLKYVHFERP